MSDLVMAIDVGTADVRAGVIDRHGTLLARSSSPIRLEKPEANHAEYASEDIWRTVAVAARAAREAAQAEPQAFAGISFDATCSLVIRDRFGQPLSVSRTDDTAIDTIAWLDHRALAEAEECSAIDHPILAHQGGVMSPEMQIPKLMWLKRHFPERWAKLGHVFDLADFLTWKASGSTARSHCTLTSKWAYLGHGTPGWQNDFLAELDLADLLECGGLPKLTSPIGADLGPLTEDAAARLGLTTACRVGVGLIDAHAGLIGLIGAHLDTDGTSIERHAALIAGTSSSVMALSSEPHPMQGVWGPFFEAALPGFWLVDAGQSASGALLDHLIQSHGAGGAPTPAMHKAIAARIKDMRATEGDCFAAGLHIIPDFHGNRSPLAEPMAVGIVSGLDLNASFDNLCKLYWRASVGIALGVRHILDTLKSGGYAIDRLHVTGGHTKNPLLMELYQEALGCTLLVRDQDHAVLTGTAAAAATAAGIHPNLTQAAIAMAAQGQEYPRHRPDTDPYARDYRIFLTMHQHRKDLDTLP